MLVPSDPVMDPCSFRPTALRTHAQSVRRHYGPMLGPPDPVTDPCSARPTALRTHARPVRPSYGPMLAPSDPVTDPCSSRPTGDCQKFRVRGQFYERESALGRAPGIPRQVFRHERAPHTRFRGDRAGRKIERRLRNRPPAADPGAGGLATGWRRHLSRSNTWTDRSQDPHPDSNRKRSPNRIANSLRAACHCDGARFHLRSTPRSAR